jgi:hypothetical protein
MDTKPKSLQQILSRFEKEDLELSADINIRANIAISKARDDDGRLTGLNALQINLVVDDEYVAHGFLGDAEGVNSGNWDIASIMQALQIDENSEIWEVEDISWQSDPAALAAIRQALDAAKGGTPIDPATLEELESALSKSP